MEKSLRLLRVSSIRCTRDENASGTGNGNGIEIGIGLETDIEIDITNQVVSIAAKEAAIERMN